MKGKVYKTNKTEFETFTFESFDHLESGIITTGDKVDFNHQFEDVNEDKIIRREREFEKKENFLINPLVKKSRGLKAQEENDIEELIENEVQKRVEKKLQEIYEEANLKGMEEGTKKAFEEKLKTFSSHTESIESLVFDIQNSLEQSLLENRDNFLMLFKNVFRWLLHREIDSEEYYQRVIQKLIREFNNETHLKLSIPASKAKALGDFIQELKTTFEGNSQYLKIEISDEVEEGGVILETKNNIVNASLDSQLEILNKIFEKAGVVNTDEPQS